MIVPRNLHPTEHKLYETACFAFNGKVYFGQINDIQGMGIYKKYRILSWTNDIPFNAWVTSSSILEDRRKNNKTYHGQEKRKSLLTKALELL